MIKTIPLADIKTADTLQPRTKINFIIIQEYAQAMKEEQPFPPLSTVWDGEYYWLWDGYHRKSAAEQAGLTEIRIDVQDGTFQDAEWFALGANTKHGFNRTNEDKRRAVELALGHPKTKEYIDKNGKPNFSQVGTHCGVSDNLVSSIWYKLYPKRYAELSENSENPIGSEFQSEVKTKRSPTAKLTDEAKAQLPLTDLDQNQTEITKLARLDEAAQIKVISMIFEGEANSVKAAKKKIETRKQIEAIARTEYPPGKYHVIVMDPPWRYEKRRQDTTHRAAVPYPDMTTDEIRDWEQDNGGVSGLAMNDCILWLWTTNAHMKEAHELAETWGFQVKTILTWVKDKMGTGDWLRGKTEHCLMAIKGKPVIDLTNQTTILNGPLREHSRKPDEFYAMVEGLCPGKKIEVFAREKREGWANYGSETGKFTVSVQA